MIGPMSYDSFSQQRGVLGGTLTHDHPIMVVELVGRRRLGFAA